MSERPFLSVARQQLVDQVIQQLRGRISAGTYQVGERLPPEADLMAQLGVGRSTLREAVRALAHAGLVEARQGSGTYVRALREADPLEERVRRAEAAEANEVRLLLELETARLAAHRRDAEDLAAMRSSLEARDAAEAAQDVQALLDADLAFHTAIAHASKNGVLAGLYETFARALRPTFNVVFPLAGSNAEQHWQLLAAIERQDPDVAQQITTALLTHIRTSLPTDPRVQDPSRPDTSRTNIQS